MGGSHSHSHGPHQDGADPAASRHIRLILAALTLPFLLFGLVGLAVLWPHEQRSRPNIEAAFEFVDARVETSTTRACELAPCADVTFRLVNGPEAGTTIRVENFFLTVGMQAPVAGDEVVLTRTEIPGLAKPAYNLSDYQRTSPMLFLLALFVVATIAVGRRSGAGALVGLGVSYLLLATFALPAILAGKDPLLVAMVTGTLIMFLVLYLASGINVRTTTALVGTLLAICVTALLARVFVTATRLTGLSSEEAVMLQLDGVSISLSGLLLAGIVIGTLGALNDVTVTQASAVWEVHRADPSQGRSDLYRAGMRVGRDHIASTIDTLVLAYAGASLPLLLLFSQANRPFGRSITGEIIAEEVVRALVGSLGLIASVPITTFVAAAVVSADHAASGETPVDQHGHDREHAHDDEADAPLSTTTVPASIPARSPKQARPLKSPNPSKPSKPAKPAKDWTPPKAERDFWAD